MNDDPRLMGETMGLTIHGGVTRHLRDDALILNSRNRDANMLPHFRQIVQQDSEGGKHPVAMTTLLERQLNECGASLIHILSSFSLLAIAKIPQNPIYSRLLLREPWHAAGHVRGHL